MNNNYIVDTNIIIEMYFKSEIHKRDLITQFIKFISKKNVRLCATREIVIELYNHLKFNEYKNAYKDDLINYSYRKFSKDNLVFSKVKVRIVTSITNFICQNNYFLLDDTIDDILNMINNNSLEPFDYLIYKKAIDNNMTLITEDKDFENLTNVLLLNNN